MAGSRLPAYCASMGRVLLASLHEPEALTILERTERKALTPFTKVAIDQLMAEISVIRDQGYAINDQELELGLRSIAVPVFNHRGTVVAAINIGAPAAHVETGGLIDRYYRDHKPVSFYAKLLGVSPTHLNRTVKQLTGGTTQDLVANKLMDTAKRDLIAMPSSVQHIAYSLGFSDPAYFSRFFLKMTGETPRAFRLRERERLAAQDLSL